MAKGQKRSTKEAKKPKKAGAAIKPMSDYKKAQAAGAPK